MKKINKTVKEIIASDDLKKQALEYKSSTYEGSEGEGEEQDDAEGDVEAEAEAEEAEEVDEEVDDDYEQEYEQEEQSDRFKQSKNKEPNPPRFSHKSSSEFSREDDNHHKSKEKSFKKKSEPSDIDEEYPENFDDADHVKKSVHKQEYSNTDKAKTMADENKTFSKKDESKKDFAPNNKESDIDEEINEDIEDNYDFGNF